jgi:hypothetical protein
VEITWLVAPQKPVAMKTFSALISTWIIFPAMLLSVGFAQLNGTYTLGGSNPDYSDFNSAITDLTTLGVSGPVVILVRDGLYQETFSIGTIPGTSASNTVIFRSESGDSTAVVLEYPTPSYGTNWALDGVSYLTLQGMTWRNSSTTTGYETLLVKGSSHNISIFNNRFETRADQEDYAITLYPSSSGSNFNISDNFFADSMYTSVYTSPADDSVREVIIKGNTFGYTNSYGVYIGGDGRGLLIEDNAFNDFFDEAMYIEYFQDVSIQNNLIETAETGIYLYDCYNVSVVNTDMMGIVEKGIETDYVYGLEVRNCDIRSFQNPNDDSHGIYGYEIHNGSKLGVRIENNTFYGADVSVGTSSDHAGIYLEYFIGDAGAPAVIANNMIAGYDVGMFLNGDVFHSLIAHNSVSTLQNGRHCILVDYVSYYGDVTFKNNLFSDETNQNVELIWLDDVSVISNSRITFDYNVFQYDTTRNLTTFHHALSDFQTAGMGVHSFLADPVYYNKALDLHSCNLALIGTGDTCSEVTQDIDGDPRPANPVPGAHEVEVLQADFTLVESGLEVSFTNTTTGDAYDYWWEFGDGNTSSDANPVHQYTGYGNYSIMLVAHNPYCQASDTMVFQLSLVSLENVLANEGIKVYPNPATDVLLIESEPEIEIEEAAIFSISGSLLWSQRNLATRAEVPVSHLNQGIYLLRLSTDKGMVLTKFIRSGR